MKRISILVEGQTEEEFVNTVLAPYLQHWEIVPTPIIVSTKRVKQGNKFKGGLVSYEKAKRELLLLLHSYPLVTTMFDFYALPQDFPKPKKQPTKTCYQRVEAFEAAFYNDIGSHKFLPYLALHEFEAMMFVSPKAIAGAFLGKSELDKLIQIRRDFPSPEEINEESSPSKRLEALYPEYQKPLDGPLVTDEIGIDAIRAECAHFKQWLERLIQHAT